MFTVKPWLLGSDASPMQDPSCGSCRVLMFISSNKRRRRGSLRDSQHRRLAIEGEQGGGATEGDDEPRLRRESRPAAAPVDNDEALQQHIEPEQRRIRRSSRIIESDAAATQRPIEAQRFMSTELVPVNRLSRSALRWMLQRLHVARTQHIDTILEYDVRSWDTLLRSSERVGFLLSVIGNDADSYEFTYWQSPDDTEHDLGQSFSVHDIEVVPNAREADEAAIRAFTIALRILGGHPGHLTKVMALGQLGSNPPLPVTASDLRGFVRQLHSSCQLGFPRFSFSEDQAKILALDSRADFHLLCDLLYWRDNEFAVLCAAIRQSQCISKITLYLDNLEKRKIDELAFALEANTCLEELTLEYYRRYGYNDGLGDIIDALKRNRGVRVFKCSLVCRLDSSSVWDRFWLAISKHPTIRVVDMTPTWERPPVRRERDLFMAHCLAANTVLQHVHFRESCHDPEIMSERVLPLLRLNRFRARAREVRAETVPALREKSFISALLCVEVRNDPSFGFVLLTENSDLFVQCFESGRRTGAHGQLDA